MRATPARLGRSDAEDPLEVVHAFYRWIERRREDSETIRDEDFRAYFRGIAEARYVIRKVSRIVDEQARRASLEPLEHRALIQIFGSPCEQRVSDLARRLDIAPAFASRIVNGLQHRGLVIRSPSPGDRRSTFVNATARGREVLATIDRDVSRHVAHFDHERTDAERAGAFGIFAFYLGATRVSDVEALLALARR